MTNTKDKSCLYLAIVIFIINVIPYCILGEGLSSAILLLIGTSYIIINKYKIFADVYVLILICITILGVISLSQSNNIFLSLEGIFTYLCGIIFYILFFHLKDKKEEIYDYFVYFFSMGVFISILYQGIYMNKRIYGNIGYVNTYSILMVLVLYINTIRENNNFRNLIEYVLISGVLYTCSRYTLVFLCIFIFLEVMVKFRMHNHNKVIINFVLSIITYTLCSQVGGMAIIFMPPIIYLIYYISDNTKLKNKRIFSLCLIIVALFSVCFSKAQLFLRLKNISIHIPVVQERLIYYEDSIKAILSNIFGFGINSYQYKQYGIQSAFYDVKYIHNSLIQHSFDLGVLGGVLFIVLFVYGLVYINKTIKDDKKIYYAIMYLSIYAHSMLEFDFSFSIITIIISMILALNKEEHDNKELKDKLSYSINFLVVMFSVYFICCSACNILGNIYESSGQLKLAEKFYKWNETITFEKNSETYIFLAQVSKGDDKIKNLIKAEKLNPYDPRIKLNMAFLYEKNNDFYNANKYYEKALGIEKFYADIYTKYFSFLQKAYKATNDKMFLNNQQTLKRLYYKNLEKLNSKSKYMKNQLPQNFNEVVKKVTN
ncbi:O-antigen ligase family protein [Clostridium botulinum]|uniref:O-antigen ligase-related domain-containing protein n=4 Tax=Clostridium botulinum TaxID=1491 RepID=A0A9Q1V052_CLOBO|nr:O-antigen ligase family protein [Clostridium botulinum]AEB75302.1 hypothetical protein CbC4_0622 [Clostridium botulinum BKT015925]KEI04586.1 hypothetical protein Y848_01240 [Clostridium botulinum C/D str. Sp77]KLU75092.1 hypothetical protein CBC3_10515 [Clostridium botulinum V891]KOA75065.1 hypothetical protein ADU78_09220 [Clostridium botulinum]KOA76186.1 hypothetical protein ADU77_09500 [Clostridium botulinum]